MEKLVAFFEIPCNNSNKTIKFYEKVFEITMPVFDCESDKMAFFPNEDGLSPGAISWAEDFEPSQNAILISLNCQSIASTMIAVKANGGKTVIPKTKIEAEDRGYFAVLADTEGSHVGLYSGE